MTEQRYRVSVVLLLAGILFCLAVSTISQTLLRPTVGNVRTSSGWWKGMLLRNQPYVDINDTIDVNVPGTVDVEISGQPVEVEIQKSQ